MKMSRITVLRACTSGCMIRCSEDVKNYCDMYTSGYDTVR